MRAIKRVALVEPKSPGYHIFSGIALPRLGLPLLGTMLERRGIRTNVYCQEFAEIDYDDVFSADLVGISTTTSTAPEGYRLAHRLRKSGIPVVLGGSHVTFMADEALEHADYCVRGEGERTLMELIDAIQADSGFEDIAGLSYRDGDIIKHNPDRPLICDLDSLPFSDLSLVHNRERIGITPMCTSRGCPFDCSFCSVTQMFGRGYRERSVENVIDELKWTRPDRIFFYDDNFTANRNRTKALLERMLSEGLDCPWMAQARVDVARDKELLALMKRSKCHILYLGLESVNPETLDEYNKRQTVEEIIEAVQVLHKNGIMTHGMFVFGAENDDVQSLRNTVNFALRNSIDTVQFLVLTPLPGTRYFDHLQSNNRLLTTDWQLYDGQHVVFMPEKMSPYELQIEMFKGMKRFYSVGECMKMVCGRDFFKFAAGLNWNLLRGRWGAARRQIESGMTRCFYRAHGHLLLKKWEAANKDFGTRVKALARNAQAVKMVSRTEIQQTD